MPTSQSILQHTSKNTKTIKKHLQKARTGQSYFLAACADLRDVDLQIVENVPLDVRFDARREGLSNRVHILLRFEHNSHCDFELL